VWADPGLLERALANLVANALAWSPAHEPVRVRATAHGEQVAIFVADRGPGIPRDQLARVFEPFQRLGDRSMQAGVGLGLAVARGFVRAMGGELELDDTPGGGLTAIIFLPVVQS
jgi:two-component system sensor histidine kinase KdpD